jgi:hypothetical protein
VAKYGRGEQSAGKWLYGYSTKKPGVSVRLLGK